MSDPIRFYFDFISPYAWLAWTQMQALATKHGRALVLEPVLFAGILDAHGQLGPAEIPAKRRYVMHDVWRKAERMGQHIALPPRHPFNPLTALRAVLVADDADRPAIVDACFRAVWAGGPGVDDPSRLAKVLTDAGFVGSAIVAATRDPKIKQALRHRTEQAIAAGVFGVPTVVVDGQMYWGTDSLPDLDRALGGLDRPLPTALEAGWAALPSGAVRPGSAGRSPSV